MDGFRNGCRCGRHRHEALQCHQKNISFLRDISTSSFRGAPPELGFTRVQQYRLSKSATADLDGASPESILPMVVMDSGPAPSAHPGMTTTGRTLLPRRPLIERTEHGER